MRNIAHHTVNTHHITSLIFLDDSTCDVEQYKFNQSMAIHMKQYCFQRESGEYANTSHHDTDVFHRGICQNTFYVALNNNERYSNGNGQDSKEKYHATHHFCTCSRKQNNEVTHHNIKRTSAQRTGKHTTSKRRSFRISVRQPSVHRCHTNFSTITNQNEHQRQFGQRRIKKDGMLVQVKPAKCFIATQRTNLCIVQNQSAQKRQADTYGTNHNILPSSFQSGTSKFKGNQECRNQSSCFDCYPHQT